MPGTFYGAGACIVKANKLRIQVNHNTADPTISEVNLYLVDFKTAISNMISSGNTGGVSFVVSARRAFDRWSNALGSSWSVN
jgi:hypothetical protein